MSRATGEAWHRQAGCAGKKRFRSPALAHRVQVRAGKAARRRGERPRAAYRCPHCGGWHLGNRQ